MSSTDTFRLTQYSHGAGCGCKIAPSALDDILATDSIFHSDDRLVVGNSTRDDAAVYDLGDGRGLISTTDFFMPIVDDAHTFGRIAAANALSDVYAMGGKPTVAIAILGWPVDTLPTSLASRVIDGGREACQEAGITLAGGHSIDSPEPIFGLAVNGLVALSHLKRNDRARPGDVLLLTKPLGVGILTTAEKRGLLRREDEGRAARQMTVLNRVGEHLGALDAVHAMTDVTGFGLLGHLIEICQGSSVRAVIDYGAVPLITDLTTYLDAGSTPGGTVRNWQSYGHLVGALSDEQRSILCDPQTSGGLLVAVDPDGLETVQNILTDNQLEYHVSPIGRLLATDNAPLLSVADA